MRIRINMRMRMRRIMRMNMRVWMRINMGGRSRPTQTCALWHKGVRRRAGRRQAASPPKPRRAHTLDASRAAAGSHGRRSASPAASTHERKVPGSGTQAAETRRQRLARARGGAGARSPQPPQNTSNPAPTSPMLRPSSAPPPSARRAPRPKLCWSSLIWRAPVARSAAPLARIR